ncbi:ribosome small subunit-dependent GTPase A [Chakrabartyella piscis]|uniref:ribosome small subunit-dependent GTPase A n=1 Tax=Chakrabartyella piscis TaxID=2918914 RepID=UPI002F427162
MNILNNYGLTERFSNEATLYSDFLLARVIAQYRGLYKIVTNFGEKQAEISGKFRFDTTELAKFPTVGDFVMVTCDTNNSNAIIHHVLTRKSVFLRTAVGVSGQAQSIAANIDTVFICMSLNHNFNLSRLERYLSVAWDSGATPVILLTKADLCQDLDEKIFEVQRVSLFSDVITLTIFEENVEQKLEKHLKTGTTSAFIGSSGVGKSTLINRLLGEETIKTADIGKADKGRHTTTGREMFVSPFGGVLIDTPGMRELGAYTADFSKTFDDIEELAGKCKFHDCTHTSEPGCAILDAISNKTLDERRFENYRKLKIEAGYDGLNAKEIEVKKLDRMFKDVGGMKNVRKFAKEQRKRK